MIQHTRYAETHGQRFFQRTEELPVVTAMINIVAVALQRGNLESLSMTRLVIRGQERIPMKRAEKEVATRLGCAQRLREKNDSRQIENIYEGKPEEFDKVLGALAWYLGITETFFPGQADQLKSWPRAILFPLSAEGSQRIHQIPYLLSVRYESFEQIIVKIRTAQRQDIFNDNGMRRMAALCALLTFDVSLVKISQLIEDASALEIFAEKSAETLEMALALAAEEPGIKVSDIV